MIIDFLEALYGKYLWLKLKKRYNVQDNHYVLIASDEYELLNAALNYLPEFLEKKYSPCALVLLPLNFTSSSYSENIIYHNISQRKLKAIIKFYTLERFFDRAIVLSLNAPFGSYGLLKKKEIDLDMLIRNYLMI